jgi:metallo-beta-lactamase family protein
LRWLEALEPPKQTFLVHGEPEPAEALAKTLRNNRGWNVALPELGESHELA